MILLVRLFENLFYEGCAGLTEGGRPGREGIAEVPFRAITGATARTCWAVRPVDRRQGSGIAQWDSTVRGVPIRAGLVGGARATHAPSSPSFSTFVQVRWLWQ